ncbi:MAG: hypothetical protein LBM99_04380 [Bacillales bacterium]|jgi:hypothetical protein|nr:hypothetical protein [Bacillales bacterium]
MILYQGITYENKETPRLIESLYLDCLKTIKDGNILTTEIVINAVDELMKQIREGKYDEIILPLLKSLNIDKISFLNNVSLFNKEALRYKVEIELGDKIINKEYYLNDITMKRVPLGILMHISAGNVDGLPAFSVIEGLLALNINILKLPVGDSGLSILLLSKLIEIEPKLKDYIYVFDIRSTDLDNLKKVANMVDGVVVWGGDLAVEAARKFTPLTTKLITYGHKLSFAYATLQASDSDLYELCCNICQSNQLLCSSPQGIFLDTKSNEELEMFAKRVVNAFIKAEKKYPDYNFGASAKNSLALYSASLAEKSDMKYYKGDSYSIVIKQDVELELSLLFRNVYIKPLLKDKIVTNFKRYGGYLQTVYLLCNDDEFKELTNQFIKAGLVKIIPPSLIFMNSPGTSHDGLYPLYEYTKVVEYKKRENK